MIQTCLSNSVNLSISEEDQDFGSGLDKELEIYCV